MEEFILKKSKFEPYTLWEWQTPAMDTPIEQYIKTQTEKVSVPDDENQFQWTR